ncbi:MAG: hypothetical protein NZL91_02965 [Thermoflexales bacterium]|nr:hypothetical protein [Thermoflexales bacterium]MCS7324530.1 hypothetical protein [Thermoflexales bacterium]MCX7939050.1 hypothetical protein [Thermoflexales bacterium]MDW8053735.1 hypothetical protein [Anaerolineae bacterium]MDW8293010.1 hypothetical protein [Anaerolineae bacterium]
MIGTLITIHGLLRWVTAALALLVIARYAWGWLGKQSFTATDRQLGSAFAVAITVQFVLGVVNLVLLAINGAFRPAVHIEHAFYGLLATGLAHSLPALKRLPDASRFRTGLLLTLVSLLLVIFSVTRLRGSFFFGML